MKRETAGLQIVPLRTPTLPPATHTNTIIIGEEDFVVLDPGSPYPDEQARLNEAIQSASDHGRFLGILVSHQHRDHIGGVTALVEQFDVPVWAHARTAEHVAPGIEVDRVLGDLDRIDLGEDSLEVWHTPGHADGHLAFVHSRTDTILAGDLVATEGTILVSSRDGHMGDYFGSLARLLDAAPGRIVPSHGEPIVNAVERLEFYIQHRKKRENKILDALIAQKSWCRPADLVPIAYSDAPRRVWPLAVESTKAHLIHLEEQGRVESGRGRWRAA